MKWAAVIAGVLALASVIAFWLFDAGTAAMLVFAAVAAAFFGSLPWIIGGILDRKPESRSGGVVVKEFDQDIQPPRP